MPGSTSTRTAIRRELYATIPYLGFYGTADSLTVTTLTDTYALQDTGLVSDQYRGAYLYRPDRSGDDIVKRISSLNTATGVITHTGANYSNTADTNYEVVGYLHPDDLNACITRALRGLYFEQQVPLSVGEFTDYDMSDSGVSSWTTITALTTKEKVTTAITGVYSGLRGLHLVNNGANSGVSSVSVPVTPLSQVYGSVILRCETAGDTLSVVLYNATASSAIRTYTTTSEHWVKVWFYEQVPSGCELLTIRVTGSGASTEYYIDHELLYRVEDRRLFAPSWLNEQFKFLKLREAKYAKNIADHVEDANSRYFQDWSTPSHFSLDPFHPESNPYAIQLNRRLPSTDMWIEAKRPYYDIETLSTESSTTTAPFDLVVAQSAWEVAKVMRKRFPTEPRWAEVERQAIEEVKKQTYSRPETPDVPKKVIQMGRI